MCVPRGAARSAQRGHAEERRHPDAAGKEQVMRGRLQWEMVLRCTDANGLPDGDPVVHAHRSATRPRIAQDSDHVTVRLVGIVAQGVLAHQAGRHFNVAMRAGGKRRQRAAVATCQLEADNVLCLLAPRRDEDGNTVHHGRSCMRGDEGIESR
jgi:hypothetical protein